MGPLVLLFLAVASAAQCGVTPPTIVPGAWEVVFLCEARPKKRSRLYPRTP